MKHGIAIAALALALMGGDTGLARALDRSWVITATVVLPSGETGDKFFYHEAPPFDSEDACREFVVSDVTFAINSNGLLDDAVEHFGEDTQVTLSCVPDPRG